MERDLGMAGAEIRLEVDPSRAGPFWKTLNDLFVLLDSKVLFLETGLGTSIKPSFADLSVFRRRSKDFLGLDEETELLAVESVSSLLLSSPSRLFGDGDLDGDTQDFFARFDSDPEKLRDLY